MIDIRCHLLDGTACGPESFGESVEMCRQARAEGVRALVAAVRWPAGAPEPPVAFAECERRVARLRKATPGGPALMAGFVLAFSAELPALVERFGAKLALGGGRHLLVSLPALETPAAAEEVWAELGRLGFSVVVARPECSPALRGATRRLDSWVEGGVTLQIDAASVTGAHGREARRFAWGYLGAHVARGGRRSFAEAGRRARPPTHGGDSGANRRRGRRGATRVGGRGGRGRAAVVGVGASAPLARNQDPARRILTLRGITGFRPSPASSSIFR